jgi:putative lipase involved disintegration of autophagic bodies
MDAWLVRHRIGIVVFTVMAVLFGLPLLAFEIYGIVQHLAR